MNSLISFVSLGFLLAQSAVFCAGAVVANQRHESTRSSGSTDTMHYNYSRGQRPVSALIVFGDSSADSGNNDYLFTFFKSNYPPYGRDFIDHKPTGRFSNGKLAIDFVADALGLKETVPPYLDPNLHAKDFLSGVTFASAGTGYDNLTANISSVMPLWKQLEYFRDYRGRLQELVGENNASEIIQEALFVSSIGSNDFMDNYFLLPIRRRQFTVERYQDFLLQIAGNFVEELYGLGTRKLGVVGLPPVGCLPAMRTGWQAINRSFTGDGCVGDLNLVANSFNGKLEATLAGLRLRLPGLRVVYVDIYGVLLEAVQNPAKYGFDVSDRGCCATGLVEFGLLCNEEAPFTCSDASKYVFWDSIHPSQRMYEIIARLLVERDLPRIL